MLHIKKEKKSKIIRKKERKKEIPVYIKHLLSASVE